MRRVSQKDKAAKSIRRERIVPGIHFGRGVVLYPAFYRIIDLRAATCTVIEYHISHRMHTTGIEGVDYPLTSSS
jgi:hypothetical protein